MKYDTIATNEVIEGTVKALNENNFHAQIVETKEEALEKIKEMIPAGASVMNGASVTLTDIGYIDFLKEGKHEWKNLHAEILAEEDKDKQAELRKYSVVSDYYLGSAHSITETGEILIASNTGSQLPHLAFTSKNIILVVGAQKITRDINGAFERLNSYVIPLEDVRMNKVYGYGTTHAKTLLLHKENPAMGRNFQVIIIKEKLGF